MDNELLDYCNGISVIFRDYSSVRPLSRGGYLQFINAIKHLNTSDPILSALVQKLISNPQIYRTKYQDQNRSVSSANTLSAKIVEDVEGDYSLDFASCIRLDPKHGIKIEINNIKSRYLRTTTSRPPMTIDLMDFAFPLLHFYFARSLVSRLYMFRYLHYKKSGRWKPLTFQDITRIRKNILSEEFPLNSIDKLLIYTYNGGNHYFEEMKKYIGWVKNEIKKPSMNLDQWILHNAGPVLLMFLDDENITSYIVQLLSQISNISKIDIDHKSSRQINRLLVMQKVFDLVDQLDIEEFHSFREKYRNTDFHI